MYGRFDGREDLIQPESAALITDAMEKGDLQAFCGALFNVFEQLLNADQRKTVEQIKDRLMDLGACGALMTGSGSCVIGYFKDGTCGAELEGRTRGLLQDLKIFRAKLL